MNPPAVEIHQCPVGQELHFHFRTKDGRELHSLMVWHGFKSSSFKNVFTSVRWSLSNGRPILSQRSHYDRTSTLVVTTDGLPWSCYDIVVTTEQLPWSCYDIVVTTEQLPWSCYDIVVTTEQLPWSCYDIVVTTEQLPWSCYDIVVTTEQLPWSCYDIVGTIDQQPWSGFGNYLTHILLGDSYDLS